MQKKEKDEYAVVHTPMSGAATAGAITRDKDDTSGYGDAVGVREDSGLEPGTESRVTGKWGTTIGPTGNIEGEEVTDDEISGS